MARDEDKRWKCRDCGTITVEPALLRAPSPFDETDILTACPHCKYVNDFDEICDEPGCIEEADCGFQVSDDSFGGYRRTCHKHWREHQMKTPKS